MHSLLSRGGDRSSVTKGQRWDWHPDCHAPESELHPVPPLKGSASHGRAKLLSPSLLVSAPDQPPHCAQLCSSPWLVCSILCLCGRWSCSPEHPFLLLMSKISSFSSSVSSERLSPLWSPLSHCPDLSCMLWPVPRHQSCDITSELSWNLLPYTRLSAFCMVTRTRTRPKLEPGRSKLGFWLCYLLCVCLKKKALFIVPQCVKSIFGNMCKNDDFLLLKTMTML
jgi:hypothetical protein